MKPVLTVEFTAKSGNQEFKEENVSLHSAEELLSFVAPGGGCESIPDDVDEIQIIFLQSAPTNIQNPLADKRVTLELGRVFLTGPLSEVLQTAERLINKIGRGELSDSFLKVIEVNL